MSIAVIVRSTPKPFVLPKLGSKPIEGVNATRAIPEEEFAHDNDSPIYDPPEATVKRSGNYDKDTIGIANEKGLTYLVNGHTIISRSYIYE